MRACALVLIAINFSLGSVAEPVANTSPWRAQLAAGRDYYEREAYTDALRALTNAQTEAIRQNATPLEKAEIWDSLGAVYEATNRLHEAQGMFDRALAIRQQQLKSPDVNLAVSLTNESSLFWIMSQPKKAEEFAAASKSMWEQLHDTERPEYAASLNNLAAAYRLEAKLREALPLMDLACKVYRQALPASSPRLLKALENTAHGFKDLGEYGKAGELHEEALRVARSNSEIPPALLSMILSGLGDLRIAQGRPAEAETLLKQAIAIERSISPTGAQLAAEYNNLSCAYRLMGKTEEARRQAESALTILESVHGQGDLLRGSVLNNLGLTAVADHDFKRAERLFHEAIQTWQSSLGDLHPNITAAYSNLATMYEEKHQFGKAERMLQNVLARDTAVLQRQHPAVARDLNNLGSLEYRRRHYLKSESYLREAVSLFQSTLGPEHPDTALSKSNLATTVWALKRSNEAQTLFADSLQILERSWGPENPRMVSLLEVYARFLRANSQQALAEEAETRAVHIRVVNAIAAEQAGKAQS